MTVCLQHDDVNLIEKKDNFYFTFFEIARGLASTIHSIYIVSSKLDSLELTLRVFIQVARKNITREGAA